MAFALCAWGWVQSSVAGSITLSWDSSTSPDIVGYRVYFGTVSHKYPSSVWTGTATEATISNLTSGRTYYFAVTAANAQGEESVYSAEASARIPNPFATLRSGVDGLFSEPDRVRQGRAGAFSLNTTARGTYSGHVQAGGTRYAISGRLNSQLQAENILAGRGSHPLNLTLQLGRSNGITQVTGSLTDGQWTALLFGEGAAFNTRTNPAPWTGAYTLALQGQVGNPSLPAGDGAIALRVSRAGVVAAAGTLGDGTRFVQSARLSPRGLWPMFAPLYSGGGLLWGWLTFTNRAGDDLNGPATWIKPSDATAGYFPAGFDFQSQAAGSSYQRSRNPATPVFNAPAASVAFLGGNLAVDFTNTVSIGPSNRVANLGANALSLTFSPATGAFQGRVADPSTGQSLAFKGVVLQQRNAGSGLLLGPSQTSLVIFEP